METPEKNVERIAEINLSYHPKVKPSQCPKICTSSEAFEVLRERWDNEKIEFVEEFKVMLLNRTNRLLGIIHLASGGLSGVMADVRVIYSAALKANACAIIMAHNHPSYDIKPSQADRNLTKRAQEVGLVLDLPVLDHLIISPDGYYLLPMKGTYSPFFELKPIVIIRR